MMECEVRIYDPDFTWINVSVRAESVQFTRDLFGVGRFEI